MNIRNEKDFFSGLLFIGVGGAFAWGATAYDIGTGVRMGPGYFPLLLGVLLAILGLVIAVKALLVLAEDGERVGAWAWRSLLFIIAANMIFGVALGGLPSVNIPAMGLIPGIYALTFMASLAGERFKFKESSILATVLAVICYLSFNVLLDLQIQAFPAFITG